MPRTGLTPQEIRKKAVEITVNKMRLLGFDKVRLTDIAHEMGISHAALYNHFPSKEALLDTVSELWLADIDDTLAKITESDMPPDEMIHLWFLALHRMKRERVLTDIELFKAFDVASANMRPFISAHLNNMKQMLEKIIKKAAYAGIIAAGHEETAMHVLFEGTMSFHHPNLVAEFSERDRENKLEVLIDTLLKGLAQ
ncbi:transcriptional regulator, TetR family [Denitrovibrio acetiphilus DSM 12809]|uniref:Transcriptional regulator, TetR family n=1 Tax=Denitrovibrio acetiphilus (strain DSM 12809 / NBRC 114555 / N2460) TaxID=522772 RepID=D4H198_DENA2|nr:TetR/AcrR family transcriptional regulator [Denitrovibrio acetiphilus]ADD66846.1 transcriptional regulator, TetR family [Denitrovibrio acetiphilus DSM 12809]